MVMSLPEPAMFKFLFGILSVRMDAGRLRTAFHPLSPLPRVYLRESKSLTESSIIDKI